MAEKKVFKVQKGICFAKWMFDAIEEIAQKGGFAFTGVVIELLRQELAAMGYNMGIGGESTRKYRFGGKDGRGYCGTRKGQLSAENDQRLYAGTAGQFPCLYLG
jgi:hypothetical protein